MQLAVRRFWIVVCIGDDVGLACLNRDETTAISSYQKGEYTICNNVLVQCQKHKVSVYENVGVYHYPAGRMRGASTKHCLLRLVGRTTTALTTYSRYSPPTPPTRIKCSLTRFLPLISLLTNFEKPNIAIATKLSGTASGST